MSTIAPPPLQNDLLQPDPRDTRRQQRSLIDKIWAIWFQESLIPRVQAASTIISTVSLENQTATIGTTSFPVGSIPSGLYEVSWYLRVTTVAGVASGAQVTIGWSESVALTKVGAANNGNLTTTYESNSLPLFRVDPGTAITYAVAYNSNPAAAMNFRIDLVLKQVASA